MTVHNDVRHISRSIGSILKQTYDNLELIVVDDGSSDGTSELVARIQDSRLRVVRPGRVGRGKALNIATAACSGELMAIQDSDDLSHPRRLEIQVSIMDRRREIALLGSGALLLQDNKCPAWPAISDDLLQVRDVTEVLAYYNPVPHTSFMIRRSLLEGLHGYDQQRRALFDYDLLVRAAASGYRIYLAPISLVGKQIHIRQQFERPARIRYVLDSLKLQCRAVRALNKTRWAYAFFPVIFLYRVLPRGLRLAAHKFRSEISAYLKLIRNLN